MATRYWLGGAPAVAQVHTGSIDSVDATPANNTFTVTIGGVAISAVGDTDVATTATNLRASLNASAHPYFAAITWSGTSGDIIGTADTAGAPFVAALTETGAGTGTVTDFAETTANAGPSVFGTAANWSGASVPVASDTIIVADSAESLRYGLDQSALTALVLYVDQSFTGEVGLLRDEFATSADGATTDSTAAEYRDHEFEADIATCEIGRETAAQSQAGSALVKIKNTRSSASTTIVHNTSAGGSGVPKVHIQAAHASADVEIRRAPGEVALGLAEPGLTATFGTVEISGNDNDTLLSIGPGVTLTTYKQRNGSARVRAAANITTATIDDGDVVFEGDGYDLTTCIINGGAVYLDGQVDIGVLNLNAGTLDTGRSNLARTITTLTFNGGTFIYDTDVTISNRTLPTSDAYTVTLEKL